MSVGAQFLEEQERKDKAESDKQMQYEIRRRVHPRTGADFDILFQELEAWRFQVYSYQWHILFPFPFSSNHAVAATH